MNRLTEGYDKEKYNSYDIEAIGIRSDYFLNSEKIESAIDKLGQLEDIEEELGIDLITLFKALKNGIWIKEKTSIQFIEPESLRLTAELAYNFTGKERLFYGINICTKRNGFNTACFNYGKTWALTKEELKNDK